MKQIAFLLIASLLFSVSGKSQNKKETEDWLTYYLNKYFDSDYNEDYTVRRDYIKYTNYYHFSSYQYYINKERLIIITTSYEVDSTLSQKVYGRTTDVIDLKKIIKIESEIDTTDRDKYYNKVGFNFIFKEMDFDKNGEILDQSVKSYDNIKNKELTNYKSYQNNYRVTSKQPETIKSGIVHRIVKAFEALVNLSGGKVIKDIF